MERVSDVETVRADVLSGKRLAHRKLNGDRLVVGLVGGSAIVTNRHGGMSKSTVLNIDAFRKELPDGTVLDGELWKRNFYPFDVLAVGGESWTSRPCRERERDVRIICQTVGVKWMWDVDDVWLSNLASNDDQWEGVVLKDAESHYAIAGSATREHPAWVKRRWRR